MPFDFKRLLSNEQMRKFLMLFLAVALCIFTAFWLAARNSSTVDAEFKQCHEACTRVSGLRRHQGSKPAEVYVTFWCLGGGMMTDVREARIGLRVARSSAMLPVRRSIAMRMGVGMGLPWVARRWMRRGRGLGW